MDYKVNESNALFTDNAYNKFSLDMHINVRYGTNGFDDLYGKNEVTRFNSIFRRLYNQKQGLEPNSEAYNETVSLMTELLNYTNVHEVNSNEIQPGEIPEVPPTKITDREGFLDLIILDRFSSRLAYFANLSGVAKDRRLIYGNPYEVIDECEEYYTTKLNEPRENSEISDQRYNKLLAEYTHFKSCVKAYSLIENSEKRAIYDEQVFGENLPLIKKEAELDLLGKPQDKRQAILEKLNAQDPRDESKKAVDKRAEKELDAPTIVHGTFYYDEDLKDYITDKNDTHTKIKNLFRVSRIGDIDSPEPISFTKSVSDPVKTLIEAKVLTERTANSMAEMSPKIMKDYKDYVALPYRWIMAKYDKPYELINEQDINKDQVIVHQLGTMFTEAFVKEPSKDNKDGQIHLTQKEIEQGLGISSGDNREQFDRPVTKVFGVFRQDKRGRVSQNIIFANVSDEFIKEHTDFFRDVFFSREYMSLVERNNAGYAGTVYYNKNAEPGGKYIVSFNESQDFIRVGALKFASLTTDEAMNTLEDQGYSEDEVNELINKFTQGQMVSVEGLSKYEVKGKKRLSTTIDKMKKRQMDFILLSQAKKKFPKISDKEAEEIVRNNRRSIMGFDISDFDGR